MIDYNVYFKLLVDDVEVPITSFSYSEDTGTIGKKLSCELADPTITLSDDAIINFLLGIEIAGEIDWVTLIENGIINLDSSLIKWIGDNSSIGVLSSLAEKWDLSPEQPIVLYDPVAVDPISELGFTPGELVDENFVPIQPLLVPKNNFDLLQLLNFVYVDKLGFSSVVTNLPNYRLNSVTIGINQSFHSVVAAEIGILEPKYSENNGNIWIIDPQGTLPPGMPIRHMATKHYIDFDRSKQKSRKINCVILEGFDNSVQGSETPTIKSRQSIVEAGSYGTIGWQRTATTTYYYEWSDGRTVDFKTTISISALADGLVRTVSIQEQEDHYKYDYRLKIGYTKSLSLYCILPGESAKMRTVNTEVNQIEWKALSTAGEFLKVSEITETTGLVLETADDEGGTRVSVYEANKNKQIPIDVSDDLTVLTGRAIKTRVDLFTNKGKDQIEVASQEIDHLVSSAPPRQNNTFQHTGTIQVRATGSKSQKRRMVIPGPNPIPRRTPYVLNAGNMPIPIALSVANRILEREGQAPMSMKVTPIGLDLSISRGSLRRVIDRDENAYLMFVTGSNISGQNLGQANFNAEMKVNGILINE